VADVAHHPWPLRQVAQKPALIELAGQVPQEILQLRLGGNGGDLRREILGQLALAADRFDDGVAARVEFPVPAYEPGEWRRLLQARLEGASS